MTLKEGFYHQSYALPCFTASPLISFLYSTKKKTNNSFVSVVEIKMKRTNSFKKKNPLVGFFEATLLVWNKARLVIPAFQAEVGQKRCCAVHCQKEQKHHQRDATEKREHFCSSATTNRTQWERRRGTQVSLKNKNNHMNHTGRRLLVSILPS